MESRKVLYISKTDYNTKYKSQSLANKLNNLPCYYNKN